MILSDFGIKTYEDFKKNIQDISYIIKVISDEFMNKHPDFVRDEIYKVLESYDYPISDKDIFISIESKIQ